MSKETYLFAKSYDDEPEKVEFKKQYDFVSRWSVY